jgi:hypothetical protein
MPNVVKTIFEAEASQYFATADAVEARGRNLFKQPTGGQEPLVTQQKALTQAVQSESVKQIETERATTKAVIEESEKRIAAKRAEAERIAQIPITTNRQPIDQRPFVGPLPVPFSRNNPSPFGIQPGIAAGSGDAYRLILQEETKQRIASLKQQETGFAAYFSNIKKLRAADLVETEAVNEAETISTVRAADKQLVARRSALFGRDALSLPIGGGLSSRIGLVGPAAIGIGVTLAAVKLGADAVASFEKANQSDLALRASIEGTGQDFRKLSAEARDFAERHSQDITSINSRYAEFLRLSQASGRSIEEIGQKATDIASKRHLSDDELVAGLKNISEGIADEKILGASATTVFLDYAQAHHQVGVELTETQKRQAVYNEFLKQGGLNAGDANQHISESVKLTTQLFNAWESVNIAVGQYISNHPAGILVGPILAPPGPVDSQQDPKLQAERDAARIATIEQNRVDLQRALYGPGTATNDVQQNVVDFALKKFVNQKDFLGGDVDKAAKAKTDAVKNAKEVIDAQVQALQTGFAINSGNVKELQRLLGQLKLEKGLIDPEKFKQVAQEGQRAIDASFKSLIESAKSNVPKLRDLYKQVSNATELLPLDQNSLKRQIEDSIKTAIDAAKSKVKELGNVLRGAFDAVSGREAARNPYLQLLDDADKRTRALRQSTQGLAKDIVNAIEARNKKQDDLDRFGLRIDTRLSADNLRDQARQFRAGRLDTDDTEFKQRQKDLEPQIANLTPELQDAARRELDQQRVDELKQITQRRVQSQLDAISPVTGFETFLRGTVSGGSRPDEQIFGVRPKFADQTPEQRAITNQRIIAATQGINPADLTPEQDATAAKAREEEATRQLDAEAAAQKERIEQTKLQTSMDKALTKLMELVEKTGRVPVDLGDQAVTVVEVTTPNLQVAKRSSKSAPVKKTADTMDLGPN